MQENRTDKGENKAGNTERGRRLVIQATIEILNFFNGNVCVRMLYYHCPYPFSFFLSMEKINIFYNV